MSTNFFPTSLIAAAPQLSLSCGDMSGSATDGFESERSTQSVPLSSNHKEAAAFLQQQQAASIRLRNAQLSFNMNPGGGRE